MSNATQAMNPQDTFSDKYNNYGILFYIAILIVIVLISIISIICARIRHGARLGMSWYDNEDGYGSSDRHEPIRDIEKGLDQAALDGYYPKFLCSEAHKFSSCCSICLGEYKDDEMLRLLHECGHLFHQKCIDPWLKMHPTCPVCRSCSLPSTPQQQSTPLSEVAPLARQGS